MTGVTVGELFDLRETLAGDLFAGAVYPWEVLPKIADFIRELGLQGAPRWLLRPV